MLVFGATGKTGVQLTERLVMRGDKVTAFVRETSDTSQIDPLGVEIAVGDVLDKDSIAAALQSLTDVGDQLERAFERWSELEETKSRT